ncbi:ribokinase [Seinonella peptonophila]|nr:ribokinase [Seinonella peptonophila]
MVEAKVPKIVVVGSLNMDIVVEAERAPVQGETILGERAHVIPGGKGANQAVAAARLEAETIMLGSVGKDDFGNQLIQSLQKEGINIDHLQTSSTHSTGIASILLSEHDNRIIVVPGANHQFKIDDEDVFRSVIASADLCLFQLEIPLSTVIRAVEIAKEENTEVILNPAPAQKLPDSLLQQIDYITPNQTELALLTNREKVDESDLFSAMEQLLTMGPKHVITTLGKDGVAYLTKNQVGKRISSHPVNVLDTTGAGDAFNAALAVAIAEGQEIDHAIRFANRVSALAVTKLGAQSGMPNRKEVDDFQ